MLFADQVEVLATWFKNWNECEQTVALYSLLKRVKKCQAKFLARCLEHCLNDCDELYPIEEEANDHEFVTRLFTEPQKATVIDQLLRHLPLLRPGNELAKHRYLQILPMVLAFAIERSEYLEESRQLLSYSLIHPAFDNKERNLLTSWMSGLDGQMSGQNAIPTSQGDLSPEVSSNTNSLELGATANGLSDWNHNNVGEESTSLTNSLKDFATHCASQSDISSPSSVATNSLPDTSLQATPSCSGNEQLAEGMADVRAWLKSLRLHKYEYLFSQMTYEDMMELTPDKLDEKNVTKGARNKIILSIRKLHERFKQLQALENEILGGGSLRAALIELKTIIQTPIKRFELKKPPEVDESNASTKKEVIEEGDIPALFTKVMGKACTQLLVSKPDEENITLYLKLIERCFQHPAFTEVHKRRLRTWKQQVNKMYRSLPRNTRPPGPQRPQGTGFSVQRRQRGPFNPHLAAAPRPLNPLNSPPLRPMGIGFQSQNMAWYGNGQGAGGNHLGNIDPSRKAASYDPRLGQRMFTDNDEAPSELNTRLDSLCLSVAEHALADGLEGVSTL